MAEAVDAIIADLSVRYQSYVDGFDKATAAHDRFTKSVPKKSGLGEAFTTQEIDQYANRHKAVANDIVQTEEATTTKVKRTRKARADQSITLDKTETASAKAAAKEKADAAIAESERELAAKTRMANIEATLAERAAQSARGSRSGPLKGTGLNDGAQRPLGSNAAAFINGGAALEVAAAKEVDALTADIATKQAGLNALKGAEKREQQDILSNMRLEKQLRAAGIEEEEILLRLETQRAAVAATRAAEEKQAARAGVTKFAEGAGIGRGGSGALVGGLVAASVATGIYEAAKAGLDYANNLSILSKQLGLTTKDLQVYQSAAESLGVTNEQLRTSFGQLATNIGKAQEGAKEQSKIFGKDGLAIDLGNARDGYKSLGDLLPSIIDRFSKIPDQARRAAFETALFGEAGRKLDPLLSGGTASVNQLADALEKTGAILSGEAIARSAKAAEVLKRVGDQLERQLADTVSQNASAITSLAKSLLEGASAMLQFINAFQRFQALSSINTGDPANVAAGQAILNQTPEGRSIARRNNDAGLAALRRGARSGDATINVGNGIGEAGLLGPGGVLGGRYIQNTPEAIAAARKQLLAQRRGIVQAESAAAAQNAGADTNPQTGKVGNLNVFAPDPKKGKKGKSAEELEAERLERDKKFTAAEASEQLARLGFLTELTSDTRQQDEYARERITTENKAKDREIREEAEKTINSQKLKGDAAALERSRAQQLIKENDANAELAIQVINRHEMSRYLEEQLQHTLTANEILVDGLNAQYVLAKTAKDRVDAEKRLLSIQIENERLALEKQIKDKATSPEARADAQTKLDALGSKQSNALAVIDRQNRNPIERYRDSLDDPQTQIQQAVADKLKSVDDAISSEAAKVLGVKDPFLKSLLQIFLQQNVLRPLYDAMAQAGSGGGGGIGGFLGTALGAIGISGGHSLGGSGISNSLFGLLSQGNGVKGFASGGEPPVGRVSIVGENGPELFLPKTAGTIIPNHAINVGASNKAVRSNGQGGVTLHQTIQIDGSGVNPQGFAEGIISHVRSETAAAIQQSGRQVLDATPARVQRRQTLGT